MFTDKINLYILLHTFKRLSNAFYGAFTAEHFYKTGKVRAVHLSRQSDTYRHINGFTAEFYTFFRFELFHNLFEQRLNVFGREFLYSSKFVFKQRNDFSCRFFFQYGLTFFAVKGEIVFVLEVGKIRVVCGKA